MALQDLNGASDPAQQIEADEGFEALKAGIYAAPANPTANT